jgi:hypothetical protein
VEHKIIWRGDEGQLDRFDGCIEKIKHPDGFSYMISTPIRTYLTVSQRFSTLEEMEKQAIWFLLDKGEIV